MSNSCNKWEKWIAKENAPGTSQCAWAHNYLDERGVPSLQKQPVQVTTEEESEQEFLLRRLVQADTLESHQETLRKMCLAWNSVAKRARDRKNHKKPYSFTLGTHIEARLRRISQQLGTTSLHETLEYLIEHGANLATEMRKETQNAIEAEKAHIRENYKPKRTLKSIEDRAKKSDAGKIQALELTVQKLEDHIVQYSEAMMRQEVLLRHYKQQAGLTDEEIEEEAKKIVEEDLRQRKNSR